MKIICSWCKKFLGEKEPSDDLSETHAKCADCLKEQKTVKKPRKSCGLCGRTQDLVKTECCSRPICEKCFMKHARFTLCEHHFNESHSGTWQDCAECINEFPTEMAVWYGTNEYNFEKLKNPPSFSPTHCSACGAVIKLSEGGYTKFGADHWCGPCSVKKHRQGERPRIVE